MKRSFVEADGGDPSRFKGMVGCAGVDPLVRVCAYTGLSASEKDQMAKLRFLADNVNNDDFFKRDVCLDSDLRDAVTWVAGRSPAQVRM